MPFEMMAPSAGAFQLTTAAVGLMRIGEFCIDALYQSRLTQERLSRLEQTVSSLVKRLGEDIIVHETSVDRNSTHKKNDITTTSNEKETSVAFTIKKRKSHTRKIGQKSISMDQST